MIKISSIKTVNMFLPGNVYNGFRKFWLLPKLEFANISALFLLFVYQIFPPEY